MDYWSFQWFCLSSLRWSPYAFNSWVVKQVTWLISKFYKMMTFDLTNNRKTKFVFFTQSQKSINFKQKFVITSPSSHVTHITLNSRIQSTWWPPMTFATPLTAEMAFENSCGLLASLPLLTYSITLSKEYYIDGPNTAQWKTIVHFHYWSRFIKKLCLEARSLNHFGTF